MTDAELHDLIESCERLQQRTLCLPVEVVRRIVDDRRHRTSYIQVMPRSYDTLGDQLKRLLIVACREGLLEAGEWLKSRLDSEL